MENEPDGLSHSPGWHRAAVVLTTTERAIFSLAGALFFVAAFALALRSTSAVWALFAGPQEQLIGAASSFLNLMLLVLMMVELAYTVTLSLRGAVLVAEPFLIVALIAVIRRLLVITVGDVNTGAPPTSAELVEPALLTAIVFVLVVSLLLVRGRRPAAAERE
jgi:uncharacterized membrane protein (DUF373 family)